MILLGACSSDTEDPPARAGATDLYWFVLGRADSDAQRRIYDDLVTRQEGFRKGCMNSAGFDYDVQPPRSLYALALEHTLEPGEFAARYALGHSTMVGVAPPPMESFADPNEARLARMSDAERERWFAQIDSCEEEVTADVPIVADWELIRSAADDLHARVRADPRVIDAESEWSSCMAEHGFEYPDRPVMVERFRTDTEQLVAAGAVPESAANHHELHELQDIEFAVSKADLVCNQARAEIEHQVYDEARSGFVRQYEVALVPATRDG